MHASYEAILYEMDKYITKVNTQIKCIRLLYPHLKNYKQLEPLILGLNRINNALNQLPESVELQVCALGFFNDLLNNPGLYSLLGSTDISSLVTFILYWQRDNAEVNLVALDQITKLIRIPKLTKFYSSSEFVQNLVYISRVNPKSHHHANLILEISKYLDPEIKEIKDLLSSLILYSRNISNDEKLQERLIVIFCQLATPNSINSIAPTVITQFSDVSCNFENNMTIISYTLTLLNHTSEPLPKPLLLLTIKKQNSLAKDPNNLPLLIDIYSSKLNNRNTPPELLPVATLALEQYLPITPVTKKAIKVCYNCLCASQVSYPELVPIIVSLIQFHQESHSLVKQATVVLMMLCRSPECCASLASSSAAVVLVSALDYHKNDQKTVNVITNMLNICIKTSSAQLARPEKVQIIKSIIEIYPSDSQILKYALSIIYSIIISTYSVEKFIELPNETRSQYYISSSVCQKVVDDHLNEIEYVKPIIICAEPTSSNESLFNKAMKRYTGDYDIQLCGISSGFADVNNVLTALSTLGDSAIRYSIPALKKIEKPFSQQLIEYLLQFDRIDTTEILIKDMKNGNEKVLSSSFELHYAQHLPIAMHLSQKNLWKATESDSQLILTVLSHSVFNQDILVAALYFASQINLPMTAISTLLEGMRNFPQNKDIVIPASHYLSTMEPTDYMEQTFNDTKAVGISSLCLSLANDDEICSYNLLKLLHLISYFPSQQSQFKASLSIPIIAKASKLSRRCANEACQIFSNICEDIEIAQTLYSEKAYECAFDPFSQSSYIFISTLISATGLKLSKEQFESVYKHFSGLKNQLDEEEALCLMSIFESYINTCDKPPKLDLKKFVLMLTVFSNNHNIISSLLRIIPFTKEYNLSEQLLFALFEVLKQNHNDQFIVIDTCTILQNFSKVDKHKSTFQSDSTAELLLYILSIYLKEGTVCHTIFSLLSGRSEVFGMAATALTMHTDPEVLLPIAQSLLNSAQGVDCSQQMPKLLNALKANETHRDVVSCILQVIFLASEKETGTNYVVKYIQLIAEIAMAHISVVQVARAVLGIISNAADTESNISSLSIAGLVVNAALKTFSSDVQVVTASSYVIVKFAQAGRGSIFKHALPNVIVAMRMTPQKTSELCDAIGSMSPWIGEYSEVVTNEVVKVLFKAKEREVVLQCIMDISKNNDIENAIFNNCKPLMDLANADDTPENITAMIFAISTRIHSTTLITRFDAEIPFIAGKMSSGGKMAALAAAQLLAVLASLRPDIVAPHASKIYNNAPNNPDIQKSIQIIREKI